jgi:PAS domain S-box-containing protein
VKKIASFPKKGREIDVERILNNIDQVIFSLDMISNTYIYISKSCESLYGYTIDEFISRPMLWENVIHPDDRFIISSYEVRIRQGETLFFQYRIIRKDGDMRWVDVKVIPTLNNENEMVGVDVIVTDITEKKENQQRSESAHSELNKLFNSIDEVLFSVDMEAFRLIHMSAACLRVYGYTPDDFYTHDDLWKSVIYPEDAWIAEEQMVFLFKGEHVVNQYRITHQDGSIRWVENKVTPALNAEGKLIRIDGVTSDITKRKLAEFEVIEREKAARLAEANLTAIIENTDAQVYSIDRDYRYITFNTSLKETLKAFAGVEAKAGNRVFAFMEETDPQEALAWKKLYDQAFTGKPISFVKDFSTGGYQSYVSFSLHPIWEGDAVVGLSCFSRDITQQKLAEQQIQLLNESLESKVKARTLELESLNSELESFSYSISHDLRAPLRIIHGFGKMLLESCSSKLDDEELENLNTIITNSLRMGALIDDLLDFSRLGRIALETKHVNMNDLVAVSIKEVNMSYPDSKAKIIQHDLKPAVGDQSLLKQVWSNLISNAVKYSAKSNNPTIEIGTLGTNGSLTYYIKDNGAGFDMQYSSKLFAVFQRLHKVTEYEGTGVGLALTNRIITKHAGRIWAEGEEGRGATFYFTLPTQNQFSNGKY